MIPKAPAGEINTDENASQDSSPEINPEDDSSASADDESSKELTEKLYNLEIDISGDDDLIQVQAVEEARVHCY